jgi:hypothetical protein
LGWHKNTHDVKIGAEFLHWRDTGWWQLRTRGQYIFSALPTDVERRFPLQFWNDPSKWDLTGLDSIVIRFDRYFVCRLTRPTSNHGPERTGGVRRRESCVDLPGHTTAVGISSDGDPIVRLRWL